MCGFLPILACAILPAATEGPWTLKTLDTEVRFELLNGGPCITRLQAVDPERPHNWTVNAPEVVLPGSVEIAGAAQAVSWKYKGASAEGRKISFAYECVQPALTLISTWESAELPGPVEHRVTLANKSDKAVVFAPTPVINLPLCGEKGHALENWWVVKGASSCPEDGGTNADPVTAGYAKSLLSGPYSRDDNKPRDAVPWFSIQDTAGNHGLYGGIEFSGWTGILLSASSGSDLSLAMGLDPRDGKTRTRLASDGVFEFPTCFIGAYTGDVDDGCNRLHRWVERHLRPAMPGGTTPVLVNNSWGSGMAVNENLARRMINDCAELGIELFHVDAGWFRNVGNWRSNPQKLPDGLEKIADYAHSKGLKFGLWVAWTQGGDDRDAGPDVLSAFNPAQKDWFAQDYPATWKNQEYMGATVCLGSPGARAWCLKDLRRIVKEYKLDLLEHDQNMILDRCTREGHGHIPGERVDTSRAAADGYYYVYDTLRAENPQLLFEDCVNGGRLVDFGVARRAHYICCTDAYDPWSLRRAFYDASHPLPPSMCELYVENKPGATSAGFKMMLRSGMLGWCTIMIDTSAWNESQHKAARREFALYKERLRPLIADGNIYHVLPRPKSDRWDGIQYADPKSGKGVLMVFRPQAANDTQVVKLKGLDPKKMYSIESEDGSVARSTKSGKELMETGLALKLTETESSDLIFLGSAESQPAAAASSRFGSSPEELAPRRGGT